jgi:hypothetical protein
LWKMRLTPMALGKKQWSSRKSVTIIVGRCSLF